MGRISIFAIDDCRHCQRVKGALKEHDLPFTEISLTTHPNRRADMLSLSDRLTVPQVFFNDKHIGGADETLQVLQEWKIDTENSDSAPKTHLQIYEETIASQIDPEDNRLRISTEPPKVPKEAPPRPESDKISLPDQTVASVLEVTETLKKTLPRQNLPYFLKIYRNCFTGKAGVEAIMNSYNCDQEAALDFGKCLQQRHIIHHVRDEHDFDATNDYYFRLQCYHSPEILNSYRIWTEPAGSNVNALITRLKKLLDRVESSVTNNEGLVDYKSAGEHELFPQFEEAVCELQSVDMGRLDRTTILAFVINLYNLGIKYAFMKVGIGSSSSSRTAFFNCVKFNVGGYIYSFQDLEHGLLRGNRRAPYTLSPPFAKSDPRLAFALKPQEVDCRIHFAVNCGANSCPPVKTFTVEGIEEELRIVAQAFCEDDSNVQLDTDNRTLSLSKIFYWYQADFASNEQELPAKVVTFLRGDKRRKLESMIQEDPKSISVKYLPYDWGTNASDAISFDAGNLSAQYFSARSLF